MEPTLDMREIESSAYRAYFEDGMWDIFFGLMFITSTIRTLTDNVWFTLLIIVAIAVPNIGKRYITIPRLGRVKFGPRRVKRQIYMLLIILAAVVISVSILLISRSGGLEGRLLGDIVFAVMVIVVTGAMGYFLEYPRLIIHGFIFAAIMLISGQYGMEAGGYAYLLGGAISLTIGLLTLRAFLKKYPPLEMEG
jgi:hypothetical protein